MFNRTCKLDIDTIDKGNCMKKYKKYKNLGKGVQGEILQVCQNSDCTYAMKISEIEEKEYYDMFIREVWTLVNLQNVSPKLVPELFNFWICDPSGYVVMEKMDMNFEEYVKRHSIISLKYFDRLIEICQQLADNSIVHGDMKLDNILMKDENLFIADFGYAVPLNCSEFIQDQPGWMVKWCKTFPKFKTNQLIFEYNLWQLEKAMLVLDVATPIYHNGKRFSKEGFGKLISSSSRKKFLKSCNIKIYISRYAPGDPSIKDLDSMAKNATSIDYNILGIEQPETFWEASLKLETALIKPAVGIGYL